MIEEQTNIREELQNKIDEVQQQMEPVAQVVSVKPNNNEGAQGSRWAMV